MTRYVERGDKRIMPCSTDTVADLGSAHGTILEGVTVSHFHKFPITTLRYLASQVGDKLGPKSTTALTNGVHVELAETFDVWFLGRTAIKQQYARLSELAHRTGYWHHQVKYDGKAKEYALSRTFGPGVRDWEIRAVMSSALAGEIDKAIHWIDKQDVTGDPLVCLLSIPAYHMTAFWFRAKKKDEIVVVDQPKSLKHLKKDHLYKEQEFLTLLAHEKHAQGIPGEIPQFTIPENSSGGKPRKRTTSTRRAAKTQTGQGLAKGRRPAK